MTFFLVPLCKPPKFWGNLLLNNFFSGMVYDDAEKLYAEVKESGEALLNEALSVLFPDSLPLIPSLKIRNLKNYNTIFGYNTTFLPRWDVIKIPLLGVSTTLKSQIMQASDDGREGYAIMQTRSGSHVGILRSQSSALHAQLLPASGTSVYVYHRGH